MRVFVLYRPRWPSLRAQALQVFHAAHALASTGVDVTVAYHPGEGDPYAWFGLPPLPDLHLVQLPVRGTAATVAFRAEVVRWARRGPGVFLAREKKLADEAQRYLRLPVVLEAHEVDSLLGRPHLFALERRVLRRAAGLITNCEGVMNGLSWGHDLPAVRRVVHNASRPPIRRERGKGVVYAGSLLAEKDLETVARAAPRVGGITLLGDHPPERLRALDALARGALVHGGGVRPRELLETLAGFEVALLPEGNGRFGREMTSPLKAFSYRAAGLPVVGADTPAVRRALGEAFVPYTVGSVDGLVAGIQTARTRWDALRAYPVRTWAHRAQEVLGVLRAVT